MLFYIVEYAGHYCVHPLRAANWRSFPQFDFTLSAPRGTKNFNTEYLASAGRMIGGPPRDPRVLDEFLYAHDLCGNHAPHGSP